MELILLILKIILIAFLVVLGLILWVVGLILFVPIHYEVSGSIGDLWQVQINGKITYLFSIIKVLLGFKESEFDVKLFLFGFEKKIQEESDDTLDDISETESEIEEPDQTEEPEITFYQNENVKELELHEDNNKQVENQEVLHEEKLSKKDASEHVLEDDSLIESTANKKRRVKKEKEKSKFDFAFIKQQLTDEHNKSVVSKLWSEICYLLKHFKFREIETDLMFSTGDPASTGQILGVLCMVPVFYQYKFHIVPDFEAENSYLKGTFLVAGKIRLIHICVSIFRLIFDKEVRLVVKRIQTLIEEK